MAHGTWQVQAARLSLFPFNVTPIQYTPGLWESAMSQDPDNIELRPKEKLITEEGVIDGIRVQVTRREDRLDWFLNPPPNLVDGGQLEGNPVIRDQEGAARIVTRAAMVSVEVVPQINRLALSLSLVEEASDLEAAIDKLSKHLPDLRFGNVGPDFLYRVNRQRNSKQIRGGTINRVATWSILQVGTVSLAVGPAQTGVVGTTQHIIGARLVLDINNVPSQNAISSKRITPLLEEFAEMASEIAQEGDID